MKLSTKLGLKGLKRTITSVALASLLLFTSFSAAIAAPQRFGSFTLEIVDNAAVSTLSNARSIDLSGIKIDVYDSVLERYDADIGGYLYAHNYSYSAYTGKDGSATFKKPSERFLVKLDLETLPDGIGIDKATVFYGDISQRSDSLSVSAIADVVVSYDSSAENGVIVTILNANGEAILAHYTINPDIVSNARSALYDKKSHISGSVTVGSIVEYYDFIVKVTGDPIQMVADALEANQISKEEALDFYLEVWEARSFGSCGTYLVSQLVALYEDPAFFSQLTLEKQNALVNVFEPSKTRATVTYRGPSGNGYFYINYEGAGLSGTPQLIIDIYDAFEASRNLFTNASSSSPFKFGQPQSNLLGTARYDVDVILDTTIGNIVEGATIWYPISTVSNIKIFCKIASYNSSLTPAQLEEIKSAISHEYMHAIMNSIRSLGSIPPWAAEGFANWAVARQYGAAGLQYSAGWINQFLGSPTTPLESNSIYKYGAVLIPLCIQINYGGDTALKNIINGLSSTSDIYTAISNATPGWQTVFSQCWASNYIPRFYYAPYVMTSGTNAWVTKPGVDTISRPSTTSTSVGQLACRYLEFGIQYFTGTLSVTISSSAASNLRCYFYARTWSSGSDIASIIDITSSINGSAYTYFIGNMYFYEYGCVAAANVAPLGSTINYQVAIA